MKFLIASDIHGSAYYCEKLVKQIQTEKPEKILLLGDLLYHGPRNDLPKGYAPKEVITLLNELQNKIIAVRGNCEAEVDQMVLSFPCMADYTTILLPNNTTIFATHGHIYSPEKLPVLPKNSIFCYGHTHIKKAEWKNNILLCNPGSVSIPKDGTNSYAIIEEERIYFKNLEGEILFDYSLSAK